MARSLCAIMATTEFGIHMILRRTATIPFVAMMIATIVIFFAANQVSYARKGRQPNGAVYNNTIIIQTFLKSYEAFTGAIDGKCGDATKTAINALTQKPTSAPCSAQFLNSLVDTIMSSAADAIRGKRDAPDSLSSMLKSIEDNLVTEMRNNRSDIITHLDTNTDTKKDGMQALIAAIDRTHESNIATIATTASSIIIAISLIITMIQIRMAYMNHKEAINRTTFNNYLIEAINNPILANPPNFKEKYNVPAETIGDGEKAKEDFQKYEWFVSMMVFSMREILEVNPKSSYWINIAKRQFRRHLAYIEWRRDKDKNVPNNFIKEAGTQINGIIDKLITEKHENKC